MVAKAKVVGLDGKPHKESKQMGVNDLLEKLGKDEGWDACVVIRADTTGKRGTEVNWVGLSPLEVVGTLGASQSMILKNDA